ncbi:MAG: hypothetical protein Kow00127_00240 [Bacteroidales bacterium]
MPSQKIDTGYVPDTQLASEKVQELFFRSQWNSKSVRIAIAKRDLEIVSSNEAFKECFANSAIYQKSNFITVQANH